MKKIVIVCTIISLFVLSGSSVWEGVARIAAEGELPETGLYIATNSFPLNTLVDITNLETGKTVRVVTAQPLESGAGLLAIISKDAAQIIEHPENSFGRIRMVQLEDNVAFGRFAQSGTEDDEWAMLAEAEFARISNDDPVFFEEFAEAVAAPSAIVIPVYEPMSESLIREPLYNPNAMPPSAPSTPLVFVPAETRPPTETTRQPDPAFFIPSVPTSTSNSPQPPLPPEPVPDSAFFIPSVTPIPEPPLPPEPFPDRAAFIPGVTPIPEPPLPSEPFPDRAAFVPGVAPRPEPQLPPEPFPDRAAFIPGVAPRAEPQPAPKPAPDAASFVPDVKPVAETAALPQEHLVDPSFIINNPIKESPASTALPPQNLDTLPMVNSLESNKYYVQIAVYSNTDAVHNELSRIDNLYSAIVKKIVVIREASQHGDIYQILVGPLTQGESGALLRRFRGTHPDAFIRTGN